MYAVVHRFSKIVEDVFITETYWDVREKYYASFLKHKLVKINESNSPQTIGQKWQKRKVD